MTCETLREEIRLRRKVMLRVRCGLEFAPLYALNPFTLTYATNPIASDMDTSGFELIFHSAGAIGLSAFLMDLDNQRHKPRIGYRSCRGFLMSHA
jgi:hypothetical protein